jgi:hypothetical protein
VTLKEIVFGMPRDAPASRVFLGRSLMRTYGSIPTDFWRKQLPQRIRGNGTAMALACYLMSSPHSNMIGVYNLPIEYIHYDTGLEEKEIRETLALFEQERFAFYDDEVIYIPSFARLQIGPQLSANDNRVRAIKKELGKCSSVRFRSMFFEAYADRYHLSYSEGAFKGHRRSFEGASEGLSVHNRR